MDSSLWMRMKSLVRSRGGEAKKTKTYLDTNVIVAAFHGNDVCHAKAFAVIDDPEREYVVSDVLWLEAYPGPAHRKKTEEVEFIKEVFAGASRWIRLKRGIYRRALELAVKHGTGAADSLHVACALAAKADVLITAEKPTKPLLRVTEIRVETVASS